MQLYLVTSSMLHDPLYDQVTCESDPQLSKVYISNFSQSFFNNWGRYLFKVHFLQLKTSCIRFNFGSFSKLDLKLMSQVDSLSLWLLELVVGKDLSKQWCFFFLFDIVAWDENKSIIILTFYSGHQWTPPCP